MPKSDNQRITSCTIKWENSEDVLNVVTRVLPKEIQVRFNSGEDLMYGKIFPITDHQKENLFNILYNCLDDWNCDNYAPEGSDGPLWQFKICTKGSCLRTVTGAETPPAARQGNHGNNDRNHRRGQFLFLRARGRNKMVKELLFKAAKGSAGVSCHCGEEDGTASMIENLPTYDKYHKNPATTTVTGNFLLKQAGLTTSPPRRCRPAPS